MLLFTDPKLEHVKPILPIMCEISQWALFNKLTEEETNTLKPLEIWTSTCHMLKNQCADDVIISKQLFSEVYSLLVAVGSSGILKGKQKLGVPFNSDKLGGIDFTKFSKLTMCSA